MKNYVGGLRVRQIYTVIILTIIVCVPSVILEISEDLKQFSGYTWNVCDAICKSYVYTLTFAGPKNSLFAAKFGGIMWGMKGGIDLLIALFMAVLMRSTGTGKMTVLLFSAEMLLSVCRYRSCSVNITGISRGKCATLNCICRPGRSQLWSNEE